MTMQSHKIPQTKSGDFRKYCIIVKQVKIDKNKNIRKNPNFLLLSISNMVCVRVHMRVCVCACVCCFVLKLIFIFVLFIVVCSVGEMEYLLEGTCRERYRWKFTVRIETVS